MEKDKIDRIIDAFRSAMYQEFSVNEEGMVVGNGGFTGSSNPKGPTAGYDPVLKLDGRSKRVRKAVADLMNRKKKREDKKALKRALDFNPYFNPRNGRSN